MASVTLTKQMILEFLEKQQLMQIASSVDDIPWVATVYYAYDEDLNLYWVSRPSRRHITNIIKNPRVAVAIAEPSKPGQKVVGMQIEGTAREITDLALLTELLPHYKRRFGTKLDYAERLITGEHEEHLYQFIPSEFSYFNENLFDDASAHNYQPGD